MKYKLLSFFLAASMQVFSQTETATEAVRHMGVGWNLGNTLDANTNSGTYPYMDTYWNSQGIDSENCWGQPTTQKSLITMMKNAGFGSIRVPITWYNHMDKNGKVEADWMKRVHEVVDYVIDNGLYCIINLHHDTGADSDTFNSWIKADMDNYNSNKARYEYLWTQIAEEFKDYDHRLLFEAYNEMLDTKSSWCFAGFNTTPYNTTLATSAYEAINNYAQSFVDAVRAVGGKNADRNLIINTYASSSGTGNWNTHLQDPLTTLRLPNDPVKNHIIFEVHAYPSIANKDNNGRVTDRPIAEIKREVDELIQNVKTHLTTKGAPVIIGEWGTSNVDAGAGKTDYDQRRQLMFQFVDYMVQQTKANGIATFYWMGLSDGLYRNTPVFSQPDLAERIAKAYHGSTFKGVFPQPDKFTSLTCFEGSKTLHWGNGIHIAGELIKTIGSEVQLQLIYTQDQATGDDIQLFYGDWSEKPNFIISNETYSGDFSPSSYYNTQSGATHTTTFTFDAPTYERLTAQGLIIHGDGITLTKVLIATPQALAIDSPTHTTPSLTIYTLTGCRTELPVRGIYVKGGKKYYLR